MTGRAWLLFLPLLAGCGRDSGSDVVARDDTVATSNPDTSSPAEGRDSTGASPTSLDWTVSERGAGPVRVGMEAAVAEARLGPIHPGQTMEGSTCRYHYPTSAPAGVAFMANEGTVTRVDVSPLDLGEVVPEQALPRTAAGVGIGSTQAEVEAAYGPQLRTELHHYTDGRYLIVTPEADTSRRIIFETDEQGRVTYLRAGRRPEVTWVEGCS
ncbi:MAG TPA: hypothetical protein VD948_01880 [Rhodothermales bacterium]|nr:hypothetical protein [Rhodothermales bacterium]